MTFAINHINASVWMYDESKKFRYQPKKMKSRPVERSQVLMPATLPHQLDIVV